MEENKVQSKEEVLTAILLSKRNSLLKEIVDLSIAENMVNRQRENLSTKSGKLKELKEDKKKLDDQSASLQKSYREIAYDMQHVDDLLKDVSVLLG